MNLLLFFMIGFPITVVIETPVLLLGLSPRHSLKRRVFAGIWLNACSYPIVILVMPPLLIGRDGDRTLYLIVAETFAPVIECILFWLAFGIPSEFGRRSMWRDFAVIVLANLASWGLGEVLDITGVWGNLLRTMDSAF